MRDGLKRQIEELDAVGATVSTRAAEIESSLQRQTKALIETSTETSAEAISLSDTLREQARNLEMTADRAAERVKGVG